LPAPRLVPTLNQYSTFPVPVDHVNVVLGEIVEPPAGLAICAMLHEGVGVGVGVGVGTGTAENTTVWLLLRPLKVMLGGLKS